MSSPALPTHCPNCQSPVFGPYCAQCGQETIIGRLRLRDFSHEYVQNFVTLEGRLWRSLWMLISQPGQLTLEFLAGRRRRFVRPIPLYLSLSFLLFVLLSLAPTESLIRFEDNAVNDNTAKMSERAPSADKTTTASSPAQETLPALEKLELDLGMPAWLRPVGKRYYKAVEQFNIDPQAAAQRLLPAVLARLPYAVFTLVPLFAFITRLMYRRRQRGYAEHVLFALHLHAFVFMSFLIAQALPEGQRAPVLVWTWLVYLTLALHRFLGGRWWIQVMRAMLLMGIHALTLAIAVFLTLLIALPFMGSP